ncbi:hypothetical protein BZE68_22810 [Salmonella enterica subsp. enterica serovar Derby]|mgnify:FL=1|jgi:hypothetical protein|uniref:Uncharacterized protein n=4 Tax=Enterobacteriaceae TaxID=543 RepID=A0A0K4BF72_ECOLX|nr:MULTISPECIES: hypothetical protein [Bacteria]EBH0951628.1 hypothetical protein [Salmonella enterica subsp. enterica serovar Infantis]EBS1840478.1 hypothetical protein [Salmonella enterica subsp. enterica serovar Potsdam]EBY3284730.1 hypothetical protein [Salmonella enterica subsp. enterica serovar Typhi]ECF0679560.1 hypothetical protein [Salmonella enterica subsp. enterica serovar Saintpaul]ECG3303291.1 hypothetical protein [Salmonella enterica subsp. enterica serovar Thompson]EDR9468526.1
MPRKTLENLVNVARQTQEIADKRSRFFGYLEQHGLKRNEDSAHLFAMHLRLQHNERDNLVHELMSGLHHK